jgi:hypothetical protein
MTRFGEFSPIGRLFTFGQLFENTEVAQFLGLPFTLVKVCVKFGKNWVGLHFGRFLIKLVRSPCSAREGIPKLEGCWTGKRENDANAARRVKKRW